MAKTNRHDASIVKFYGFMDDGTEVCVIKRELWEGSSLCLVAPLLLLGHEYLHALSEFCKRKNNRTNCIYYDLTRYCHGGKKESFFQTLVRENKIFCIPTNSITMYPLPKMHIPLDYINKFTIDYYKNNNTE